MRVRGPAMTSAMRTRTDPGAVGLALVTDAIACYRLTKLITDDKLTETPRNAVIEYAYRHNPCDGPTGAETWEDYARNDRDAPKLATLVTCRWCTGVWVAAAVTVARRVTPRTWAPVAEAAVCAAAAALLARFED